MAPPNSTVNAANPDHHNGALALNRRAHPRTVVNGTSNRTATPPIDNTRDETSASASPIVSTTSNRPTNAKLGSNAWDTRQAKQRARTIHNR